MLLCITRAKIYTSGYVNGKRVFRDILMKSGVFDTGNFNEKRYSSLTSAFFIKSGYYSCH